MGREHKKVSADWKYKGPETLRTKLRAYLINIGYGLFFCLLVNVA
jgi:hypothetical protein